VFRKKGGFEVWMRRTHTEVPVKGTLLARTDISVQRQSFKLAWVHIECLDSYFGCTRSIVRKAEVRTPFNMR
jgi:hypothetical protein